MKLEYLSYGGKQIGQFCEDMTRLTALDDPRRPFSAIWSHDLIADGRQQTDLWEPGTKLLPLNPLV